MRYRPEVDGLRALAVVPVVLFHAGFAWCSGGYAGVDVFFVISGYLISSIILDELAADRFSAVVFYERRARRILPALFTVLLVCLPCAWLWLLPQDMKEFGRSLAAVSLSVSNLLFWRTSGYFDTSSDLKPLLHTWSLGVEEQFYLVFPLTLLLVWRYARRWLPQVLLLAALASLALAQWGVVHKPSAAFYLLPTRSWELLVGSLVALCLRRRVPEALPGPLAEAGGALGLMLLAAAVFGFERDLPFPGVMALVPTLGAALILLCAHPATGVGRLLSSRPLVAIGLVSYSLYLWHQPLLAFARHDLLGPLELPQTLAMIVASGVLAWLTWKYIEVPFRRRDRIGRKAIFSFAAAGSAAFLALGVGIAATQGLPTRFSPEQRAFLKHYDMTLPEWHYMVSEDMLAKLHTECDFYDLARYRVGNSTNVPVPHLAEECYRPVPGKHIVFLWGDSHSQQLYYGLSHTLPADWQLLQVASSGCGPRLHAHASTTDYCDQSNWFAWHAIAEVRPEVVVVSQNLGHDLHTMEQMSSALTGVGVGHVIFTGPTPHWNAFLPKVVVRRLWNDASRFTWVDVDRAVMRSDRALKASFPGSATAEYVSAIDYFCNAGGCLVYYGNDRKAGLTSFDYGHLRPVASEHFARDVLVPRILKAGAGHSSPGQIADRHSDPRG